MWWFKNPPKDREAYGYIKRHEHPFAFCAVTMEKKIEGELFKPMLPNLFSVHCRAATVGNVEKKNAHPFAVDHVIGMHNGSITTDFTNKKQFDTDSEALYHNIATMGVDAAIKDLPFSAAYALVWLDRKKNTLNFLRNAQRPLFVVHQGITLYWSSLEEDLIWGLKLDPPKVETKTSQGIIKNIPLFFKPNVLYSIPSNESGEIRWETKDIEPRSYIHHANTGGYNGQGSFFLHRKPTQRRVPGQILLVLNLLLSLLGHTLLLIGDISILVTTRILTLFLNSRNLDITSVLYERNTILHGIITRLSWINGCLLSHSLHWLFGGIPIGNSLGRFLMILGLVIVSYMSLMHWLAAG